MFTRALCTCTQTDTQCLQSLLTNTLDANIQTLTGHQRQLSSIFRPLFFSLVIHQVHMSSTTQGKIGAAPKWWRLMTLLFNGPAIAWRFVKPVSHVKVYFYCSGPNDKIWRKWPISTAFELHCGVHEQGRDPTQAALRFLMLLYGQYGKLSIAKNNVMTQSAFTEYRLAKMTS